MGLFKNDKVEDEMRDSLDKALRDMQHRQHEESRSVVPTRPARPQPITLSSPIDFVAYYLESLKYGDMIEVATEMHALALDDPPKTAEDFARLFHRWALSRKEKFLSQQGHYGEGGQ